jgi:signal transduction histidine kinase
MQRTLQETLKEQRHLANLGLAVSKINHDMRNILASAQLISDRLADVDDPMVKRFSPKLLRAIDRAESYTRDVLDYGRAREADPRIRLVRFDTLVADVRDLLILDHDAGERRAGGEAPVEFVIDVPEGFEIEADAEQMFRVVHNICRNALEALRADTDAAVVRRITVSARHEDCNTIIDIEDTGPGMPAKARENLFKAFHGSARAGGTGLGLAISQELVQAHGGTIELVDRTGPGTQFRIRLPRPGGKQAAERPAKATPAGSGNGRPA